MQDQAKHRHPLTLLYEYFGNIGFNSSINSKDVCNRITVHSYHRMGYDGQNKVLSTQYAFVIFCALLFVSTNSDQNTSTDSEAKSYVQWNIGCLQKDLPS